MATAKPSNDVTDNDPDTISQEHHIYNVADNDLDMNFHEYPPPANMRSTRTLKLVTTNRKWLSMCTCDLL